MHTLPVLFALPFDINPRPVKTGSTSRSPSQRVTAKSLTAEMETDKGLATDAACFKDIHLYRYASLNDGYTFLEVVHTSNVSSFQKKKKNSVFL
jgi:hypothetical protein